MEEESHDQSKSFKDLGLCDALVEACNALNWETPTKIQAEAIPLAVQGKDIIGLAQTGSGKTGAFALPIIQALLDAETVHPFFALVLAPVRELAIQIAQQFEALGAGISLKTAVLFGGEDKSHQQLALAKRPHIIVATPGRLLDHLTNTKGFSLRTLKYLVLDEADRLLQEEFEKTLQDILKVIPRERRTFLFSATMTDKVDKLQKASLRNPVKVKSDIKYSTVDSLKQEYLFVPAIYKGCYLLYILTELSGSSTIVFTNTCDATQVLALMLRNLNIRAVPINGKMTEPKRIAALNKFKAGECNVLIATELVGRGFDIPSVDMVINYDMPRTSKDYIHRVGRTARAGRSGIAISLVNQYEVVLFLQIEKLIGKQIPKHDAEEKDVLVLQESVSEAKKMAHMKIRESGGRKRIGMRDEEGEEIQKYLDKQIGKRSKKPRR